MKLIPIKNKDQVSVGTILMVKDKNGIVKTFPVIQIKKEEFGDEVILEKKNNLYFNIDRLLVGNLPGWIMEVYIVAESEEEESKYDLIATHLEGVCEAFEKINSSRLSRELIVLLIQQAIGPAKINKQEINLVLDYAPKLKQIYLKKQHEK